MSKGGGGPNPAEMGQAQAAANQAAMLQSILGSQFNQRTPFGNLTWSGDVPIVDQKTGQIIMPGQGAAGDQGMAGGQPQSSQSQPSYGSGGEIFYPENMPPPPAPPAPSGGTGGGQMQQANPRTMTVELSPHGQYMQGGQEQIAKALLDRASRTTTQVQNQPAFSIAGLGLPQQVGNLGMSRMLGQFTPTGAAGMAPAVSSIAQALMQRGR